MFESGQLGQAFQMAAQAVQQDPSNFDAWCVIGHIKQFQGLLGEAKQCAEHALKLRPESTEAALLLASTLGAMGKTASAVAACDAVLERDRGNPAATIAKAGFLERAGDTNTALALVENVEDLNAGGVRVRALLREGRFEEALETADSFLKDETHPVRRRYHLYMLKARALDRLGRYDEAFAAGSEGNALVTPEGASGDGYVRLAEEVIKTYTREAVGSFPKNASDSRHVFIAGFPRTGTTLVEQILDAHPGAEGVGEAKEIDVATRSLQAMTGAFVGYPACAEFTHAGNLGQIAGAYEAAMKNLGHTSAPILVNKNLQNLLHVGFIHQLFPEARFILTRRDPRDVAVSCFFGQFRAEATPYLFAMDHIADALAAAERLTAHWLEVLPGLTTAVRYEDLVRDHESETKRLVEFAGLPWDERCLRYYESGRTVMTLAYDQVSRPIYDSSIGRHRNYGSHLGRVGAMSGGA